ncbi:DUF4167 domain-containing protein [Hirschia maritima]|uniref:DUF4167 domain-containing protein n=1 Tax=Hirschia maritima TaxID=1121961 RepID=UPI0003680811|nr:DUF4167 domain-containing protein [Hirschia maritima]
MKRQRGRGRKPNNSSNRSLESNGPEVKIRGSASQIYEKYVQYARDAQTAGDRVKAENMFQHAEHYYRIMQANMPKDRPNHHKQNEETQSAEAEKPEEANAEVEGANASAEAVEDPLKVVDAADETEASSDNSEESPSDVEEKPAPKRRTRRPRRKPAEAAAEPKQDEEARSALDALAEQQAEIAGN